MRSRSETAGRKDIGLLLYDESDDCIVVKVYSTVYSVQFTNFQMRGE